MHADNAIGAFRNGTNFCYRNRRSIARQDGMGGRQIIEVFEKF